MNALITFIVGGMRILLAVIVIFGIAYGILFVSSFLIQIGYYLFGKNVGNLWTWTKKWYSDWKRNNESIGSCDDKPCPLIIESFRNNKVQIKCTRCGDLYGTDAKDFQHAAKVLNELANK